MNQINTKTWQNIYIKSITVCNQNKNKTVWLLFPERNWSMFGTKSIYPSFLLCCPLFFSDVQTSIKYVTQWLAILPCGTRVINETQPQNSLHGVYMLYLCQCGFPPTPMLVSQLAKLVFSMYMYLQYVMYGLYIASSLRKETAVSAQYLCKALCILSILSFHSISEPLHLLF